MDEAEVMQLYYDVDNNVMFDENGFPVFNIYTIVSPVDLFLFKTHKEYMLVQGKNGYMVELIYPEDDFEDDYYEFLKGE